MSDKSHLSEGMMILDALYFGVMQAGSGAGTSTTTHLHGPVEQQLVNISGGQYDVGRKLDNLGQRMERMDQRMDALGNRMGSLENMMRLFIDEMSAGIKCVRG